MSRKRAPPGQEFIPAPAGGIPADVVSLLVSMHADLIELLRRRETIIADHAWRDRSPTEHLDALRQVSEAITAWAETQGAQAVARLRHYLSNASFAKARHHLEAKPTE